MKEKKCGYKRSDVLLYIQNRMSREEETEFQQHLLQCKECCDDLAQLRSIMHAIGKKERSPRIFHVWMVAASVACILLGGGAYWHYRLSSQESISLPEGNHELKINPPVMRNDRDSITSKDTVSVDADTLSVKVIVDE